MHASHDASLHTAAITNKNGADMNRHTTSPAAAALLLLILLAATGCGEGPVNDNEGTSPGITEGPGTDVGPEGEAETDEQPE